MTPGKLYLLPCSIGEDDLSLHHLPLLFKNLIQTIDIFVVENVRSARRFLIQAGISKPIDQLEFFEMEKHQNYTVNKDILMQAFEGKHIALLSESGLPCIADPGNHWVWEAHQLGIEVVPISGPSSIYLLLMASGLNGQQFTFHGYLPKESQEKKKKLKEIESSSLRGCTHLFIETPYRNNQLLSELLNNLNPQLILSIGVNISSERQHIKTHLISEWRKMTFQIPKEPCIFAVGIR